MSAKAARLGEQIDAAVQPSVMNDSVVGVTGCEQVLQLWTQFSGSFRKLAAIHARQADIGEQHLNAGNVLEQIERAYALLRHNDNVAQFLQQAQAEVAHRGIVLQGLSGVFGWRDMPSALRERISADMQIVLKDPPARRPLAGDAEEK